MKVLQINSMAKNGCIARIAYGINNAIVDKGYKCAIAFGRGEEVKDIDTIKIGSTIDVYIHTLYSRVFDKQGFASIKSTKEFIKIVKNYSPDIVHLHNIHGNYINVKILFEGLKELNIPVVWTLHDCWAFTGHCVYYDYVNCHKWKKGCFKCPRKLDYPKSYIVDNSKSNYRVKNEIFTSIKDMVIVTPSEWLKREVKKSFLKEYKVHVINNGIDLNAFKFRKDNLKEKLGINDEIVILGVANQWHDIKGFQEFRKLSHMLDKRFKLVMVGGITRKQKKQLSSKTIVINKTDSIEELSRIYSTADIFLNPTHEDNFPTTNLEALACGTPVITFNTGGSIEAIDSTCGKELLDLLKNFQKNNFKREDCINKSKDFNQLIKFKEYVNLYENILNKRDVL